MKKIILIAPAISGASAVIMGAFGAHGLKPYLSAYSLSIYEKAVHYQFFHTAALLAISILLLTKGYHKTLSAAAIAFIVGIKCFSGSLYLLALRDVLSIDALTPILGPITPLGGLSLITGWILLGVYLWKVKVSMKDSVGS